MAEQVAQDVVKEAQSMGDSSPVDDSAATTSPTSAGSGQAPQPSSDTVTPADVKEAGNVAPEGLTGVGVERSATPAIVEEGVDEPLQIPTEDAAASSAIADLSGGSDTDTSRADGSEAGKDRIGHVRSNSLKKPATFKSVSVTKSFLAKAATASPVSKSADSRGSSPASAIAAAQSSARPRLVAKSGSTGLTPRSGLIKGTSTAGGPDASKVWNKNQPVAPTPPKQLTDEELKQQYGIHMATRLQAGDGDKESKWADIDDDEDDWVPDSVEWMDGTKSSVMAGEAPVPQEEAEMLQDLQANKLPAATATLTLAQRPSSTSGTKTILKPGTHAQPSPNQQKVTNGLVLKGAPEKPTLVAKSPSSNTAKSPWATLPPVDKVPPVAPPVQPLSQSRFVQQDPHGFGSLPPLTAAKEIAADDFNRSWRDEQTHRTLFDSKSGRYEPVNDARRNSIRDHSFRQPALLQRPSGDSKGGPAEPSAAFQTSRSGADGSWGRRRASSSLSGGSGALARRMSIGRSVDGGVTSLDTLQQRRESSSINGSGVSPVDQFRAGLSQDVRSIANPSAGRWARGTPADSHAQQPQDEPQPAAPTGDEQAQLGDASAEPLEDPVARQQRLMREKLDRARAAKQRELEKEQEEAAARAERLRLKMASLAPASPAPIAAAATTELAAEMKQQPVQPPEHALQPPRQQEHLSPSKGVSPPKPQIPSTDGETTQFGLIKLHPLQSSRKPQHETPLGSRAFSGQQQSQFSSQLEGLRAPTRGMHAPLAPPSNPEDFIETATGQRAEGVEGTFTRKQDIDGGWGQVQSVQPSATGNIWGAGFGTLGNGTFNQSQAGDANARSSKQDARTAGPLSSGRYGPASVVGESSQGGLAGWSQFQHDTPEPQKPEAEAGFPTTARTHIASKKRDPADAGRTLGDNIHNAQPLNGLPNGAAVPAGSVNIIASLAPGSGAGRSGLNRAVGAERAHVSHAGTGKPSSKFADFFGARTGSNSPPPPDALNNELLDGNPRSPGVRLPAPKPQVRLPSASRGDAALQMPVDKAQIAVATMPTLTSRPHMPLASRPDWASRFRNLLSNESGLNVASTQAGSSSGAVQPVSSASKTAFSVTGPIAQAAATVSLPASNSGLAKTIRYGFVVDNSSSVSSKPSAEEAVLEERQFGSLPGVRVPRGAYLNQDHMDFPRRSLARHPNNKHRDRPVEVSTVDAPPAAVIELQTNNKGTMARILIPGMASEKTKLVPRKSHQGHRQFSGSGRGRGRGNHHHQHHPNSNSNNNSNHSPRGGAHK